MIIIEFVHISGNKIHSIICNILNNKQIIEKFNKKYNSLYYKIYHNDILIATILNNKILLRFKYYII